MTVQHFLDTFIPQVQKKSLQVNQATWILETTGSADAAALKAELETELRLLFNDKETFDQLIAWDKDPSLTDPLLKRQLNVLIRSFKPNLISKELLGQISQKEAELSLLYSNFRAVIEGKSLGENAISEILKKEPTVQTRKKAWDASKQVGKVLASDIIDLVHLRNKAAQSLGYKNYFSMQLELQEVDEEWLFNTLDQFSKDSAPAYLQVIEEIEEKLSCRFQVPREQIGPWAWAEPFCQSDPLDNEQLDQLIGNTDILATCRQFYQKMGFDIETIIARSDNFERPGKNQRAFCIDMDRKGDVRTLNNVRPTMQWLETVLHELGHAVYSMGYAKDMPWLLRDAPHMITTEAMALLAGRQAYRRESLDLLISHAPQALKDTAEISLKRRQLIFSRWALVMTYFERELYNDPNQDLHTLWWAIVEKHQKIPCTGSTSGCDWAAKYHIGLAPVYYYSYLLGEFFASTLEEASSPFCLEKTGHFLSTKVFNPANSLSWNTLIEHATGRPLQTDAWLKQFAR